ncbi:hypothetical protein P7C70_g9598, partial [Phenoliferia sp. Uapishka_3]
MATCFVCSELINGDAAFIEHHINACLDKPPPVASTSTSSPLLTRLSPSPTDALLALQLSQSSSPQPVSDGVGGDDGEACPLCSMPWEALGVGEWDVQGMQGHAQACLDSEGFNGASG